MTFASFVYCGCHGYVNCSSSSSRQVTRQIIKHPLLCYIINIWSMRRRARVQHEARVANALRIFLSHAARSHALRDRISSLPSQQLSTLHCHSQRSVNY